MDVELKVYVLVNWVAHVFAHSESWVTSFFLHSYYDVSRQVQQQTAKEGNYRPSQGTEKWFLCSDSPAKKDCWGKQIISAWQGQGTLSRWPGEYFITKTLYSDGKNILSMILKNLNNVERYKGRVNFLIFLIYPQLHSPEVIITTFMHVFRSIF